MNLVVKPQDEIGNVYEFGKRYRFNHDDIPFLEFSGKLTSIELLEDCTKVVFDEVVFFDSESSKWVNWNNGRKSEFKKIHIYNEEE